MTSDEPSAAIAATGAAKATWHTIVTAIIQDTSGTQVLLEGSERAADGATERGPMSEPTAAPLTLPRIRIEGYEWVAESETVVARFAERLGFPPWIQRAMRFEEAAGRRVDLTVVLDSPPASWDPPANLAWHALDALSPLPDPSEEHLLDILRAEGEHGPPPHRRPWALDGSDWRDHILTWTDDVLAAAGRVRTGPVTQQRTWGISCVLRVPTDRGLAYLKAAARLPLFVTEGPFVAWLAQVAPEHSPEILGAHEREGWLLTADFGPSLRPSGKPAEVDALLRDALRTYGRLQRRLSGRLAELRAIGAHARGLDWLADEIEPLLADPLVAASVEPAVLGRLRGFAPRLRDLCAELASHGIPDSLLHGDLHPGNMAMAGDRLIIFDWTDAAIGHPFLDPFVATDTQRPERTAAIREGYLEAWAGAANKAALARAWELARPLAMLYQAGSYRHLLAGLEPMARPGLDGGLSGWLELLVKEGE